MSIEITFEPFRVKTVEPIRITTRAERAAYLREAGHNLFRVPAERVMIDLITDSGTGAMSSRQWSAMMRGEESHAGSPSHRRLVEVCDQVFGICNVLPTHQGRVSERLLVEAVIGNAPAGRGMIVPNDAHFDTTRRMIELSAAEAVNLLNDQRETASVARSFMGNMDLRKLERLLRERGDRVPFVMVTITCNSNGGQPVSLGNLRGVREICDRFGKKLFLDGCRFAENACFIKQRERGQGGRSVCDIVREMFDLSDGAVMSARKDALCNTGGLLLIRDDELFQKACGLCVLTQGFGMTYGSLPARDLEAMAVGLQEAMDEVYLTNRIESIRKLAESLAEGGVPVVLPAGGHAVYLDAEEFLPHGVRGRDCAAALVCAIYEHNGIRASRIGTVMRRENGEPMEVVRLAFPRRTYTQAHLEYVAAALIELKREAGQVKTQRLPVVEIKCAQQAELEMVG